MVMRAVICKGDPTSHGGTVLEGNDRASVDGRLIAQQGHQTYCPQCKGNFPIAEGLAFHNFYGVGTAVEGMKTGCGATLIATTTQGRMMIDVPGGAGHASPASPATGDTAPPVHHGQFRAVDIAAGRAVPGMPYRIELPDGRIVRGLTDAEGYTERVDGEDASTMRLFWETSGAGQPG